MPQRPADGRKLSSQETPMAAGSDLGGHLPSSRLAVLEDAQTLRQGFLGKVGFTPPRGL